jgi:hypothetical protein
MLASVGYLVIDTMDPQRLAPFWCALLDVQVDAKIGHSTARRHGQASVRSEGGQRRP